MELLALALLWPFLLLLVGLVFLSGLDISSALIVPMAFFFLIFAFGMKERLGISVSAEAKDQQEDLDRMRRGIIVFSIALLIPMFVKYLLAVSEKSLLTMVLSLAFAFGVVIWGMFIKNNKVLTYANSIGGGLAIVYLYFQLWSLGQLAQVIATAFGLLVAIIISVVKFREKLI